MLREILVSEIKIQPLNEKVIQLRCDILECDENRQALTDFIPLKTLLQMYDTETLQETLKEMGYI